MALRSEQGFNIELRRKKTRRPTVGATIRRDIPFLVSGVALDLATTEIVSRAGSGLEAGPGSALVMIASHNYDTLGLPTLAYQASGIILASAVAYGLTLLAPTRKGKLFLANGLMLGLAGIHVAAAVNNMWDLAYMRGEIPVPGPLDGLVELGLTGLLNFLDWWSPEPGAK